MSPSAASEESDRAQNGEEDLKGSVEVEGDHDGEKVEEEAPSSSIPMQEEEEGIHVGNITTTPTEEGEDENSNEEVNLGAPSGLVDGTKGKAGSMMLGVLIGVVLILTASLLLLAMMYKEKVRRCKLFIL